jgi:inhibitor of cysteine peptidase
MQTNRLRHWAGFLLLAVLVFLPLAAHAATKTVTDADTGGSLRLKLGDRLEVRLPSNPSTGYRWQVHANSTPRLKLVSQSQTVATEPGVGRPILQIFTFKAKQRGAGVLLLHYFRSWEKPTPDEKQFEMRVTIR